MFSDPSSVHNGFILESGNLTIRNLTIDGDGGVGGAGSRNYRGGIVTDYNVGGVFNNVTISNDVVANIYDIGVYLDGGDALGSGSVVSGDYIHDVGGGDQGLGILMGSVSGSIANNEIDNTTGAIAANSWYGADGAPLLSITGNSITGTTIGMNLAALADGSSIGGEGVDSSGHSLRNTIDLTPGSSADVGILVSFADVADARITIDNNEITGSGGDAGIWLFRSGAQPVTVENNVLTSTTSTSTGPGTGTGVGIFITDDQTVVGESATPNSGNYLVYGNSIGGFQTGINVDGTAAGAFSATIGGSSSSLSNTITGAAAGTGILVQGANASATITGNIGSISGNAIGINVEGSSTTATTISGNDIYDNTTGIKVGSGAKAAISGNTFQNPAGTATANTTDLLVASGAASVTLGGNAFAATKTYIDNESALPIDATGETFGSFDPSATAVTTSTLSSFYGVEDKITDALDSTGLGYVRIKSRYDFVTQDSDLASHGAISRGVAVAASGDIVEVQAGSFVDNVTIPTSLTLNGAGQGQTVVLPATSNPNPSSGSELDGSVVFLVDADNVTIEGLTVNGNNPLLTGVTVGGVNVDACAGIVADWNEPSSYTGMTVKNVTVENVYLRGIEYADGDDFGTGTTDFENDTVTNVQGDPDNSIAIFSFGGNGTIANNVISQTPAAIATNWSYGTEISGNTITYSGTGIHSDNNGGAGGVADSIHDNHVSLGTSGAYGIFVFVPYMNVSVQDNNISGVDVGLAAFGGAGGSAVFSGNTVSVNNGGTGALVTTDTLGYGQMDVSASFSGNALTGGADGNSRPAECRRYRCRDH